MSTYVLRRPRRYGSERTPPTGVRKKARLPPAERESMILDAALEFFSEYGFAGQTRDLAKQLGVSQGLLYRYFDTKEDLIDNVCERVFLSRWNPGWTEELRDRRRPLCDRLKRFYRAYLNATDDRHWIRVAMYSTLAGRDSTHARDNCCAADILGVIAEEVNAEYDLPDDLKVDVEFVGILHSAFIFWLVRKYILKTGTSATADDLIETAIDNFLEGISGRLRKRPRSVT